MLVDRAKALVEQRGRGVRRLGRRRHPLRLQGPRQRPGRRRRRHGRRRTKSSVPVRWNGRRSRAWASRTSRSSAGSAPGPSTIWAAATRRAASSRRCILQASTSTRTACRSVSPCRSPPRWRLLETPLTSRRPAPGASRWRESRDWVPAGRTPSVERTGLPDGFPRSSSVSSFQVMPRLVERYRPC